MQLGGDPECVHHCAVCLRSHGTHLRQAPRHQAPAAQPKDLQPQVRQHSMGSQNFGLPWVQGTLVIEFQPPVMHWDAFH